MTFDECFSRYKTMVEQALSVAVPDAVPPPLYDAMRYSLLAGGKRLRPVMLLMAHAMLDERVDGALPFAVALEMIHTYSLIHDDLPAMDNDTLRRGKPTNHVVYGEAMAILAGDGLLNLAFETMLQSPHPRAFSASGIIASYAGVTGMIAGQTLDVTHAGETPDAQLVAQIHQKKTACLLTAPVLAGLTIAGADEHQLAAGKTYGEKMGVAFQIIDDLLDMTGDEAMVGKHLHKDAEEGKMTYPALWGAEQSRADAKTLIDEACGALDPFGERAEFLKTLAFSTLSRVK